MSLVIYVIIYLCIFLSLSEAAPPSLGFYSKRSSDGALVVQLFWLRFEVLLQSLRTRFVWMPGMEFVNHFLGRANVLGWFPRLAFQRVVLIASPLYQVLD